MAYERNMLWQISIFIQKYIPGQVIGQECWVRAPTSITEGKM